MTQDDVIGLRAPDGWLPSPRLLALWHAAGARQPLQPAVAYADRQGLPTVVFLGMFHGAFRQGLQPDIAVVTSEGKPTEDFLVTGQGVGL